MSEKISKKGAVVKRKAAFIFLCAIFFLPVGCLRKTCVREGHYVGYIAGQPVNVHYSDVEKGTSCDRREIPSSREEGEPFTPGIRLYGPLPFGGEK